jgi:HD-like signal output (HDOD) protein
MALVSLSLMSREDSLKNLDKLPKLSPLMMQFLGLVSQPGCEVGELAALVEKDTLLTSQILQKANSAVFGRVTTIYSVQHAIAMLGLGTMRRFAFGLSLSNLFGKLKSARSFSMRRFNLHSVATGTLVELLAEELPVISRQSAFVAGLLHDIGKLMIAVHMPRQFEDVLSLAALTKETAPSCERQLLGVDHAELSSLAVSRWDLSDSIVQAARFHHDPEKAKSVEKVPAGQVSLTMVVHKADAFVNSLGLSVLPPGAAPAVWPDLDFGVRYPAAKVQQRFETEKQSLRKLFH